MNYNPISRASLMRNFYSSTAIVGVIFIALTIFVTDLTASPISFAIIIAISLVLSLMSCFIEFLKIRACKKQQEDFNNLKQHPEIVDDYFLVDTLSGRTVLGIILSDGKELSLFSGIKAIRAFDELKLAWSPSERPILNEA